MIDAAQIDHLAALARLELTPDERQAMREDLSRVLGYFEQLGAAPTEGVSEMQRPVDLLNVLREDVPGEVLPAGVVPSLTTETQDRFIRVPRTVETE